MDGNRFDDLTKTFIKRGSRRGLLKAAAGGLTSLVLAVKGGGLRVNHGSAAATLIPCVLTCPESGSQPNDPATCGATVNYAPPTFTGDCGPITCNPIGGSFFAIGTTPVTCQDTTVGICSFNVNIFDLQPPSITCPANFTTSNDPNQCGAVVTYTAPAPIDNCPGVTTVCSPASGSFFPVGSTPVTCTATDSSGKMASCGFSITVNDTQPPIITCTANIMQNNDPGQCAAVVLYSPPTTISENCPTVKPTVCVPDSGAAFPIGTTSVTCSWEDMADNEAVCSFTITINDIEDPAVTCPADIVVGAPPGADSAVVDFTATATDNCPDVTYVCDPPSGSDFLVGDTPVSCTATDASGNDVVCTLTVTVNAVAAPTATAEASPNPTGGITTLPSTGGAPTGSSGDLEKWGPLALIGGAASFFASHLRKSAPQPNEES